MYEVNLDSQGKKQSRTSAMYDLSLERRVTSRRDSLKPSLDGMQYFDRRSDDRRRDRRPLSEFPFLPEAIL